MTGMARNADREAVYTYIDPPIYYVRNVVIVRSDDTAVVPTLDALATFPKTDAVIVQQGTAQSDQLAKIAGIKIESGAKNADAALQMLLATRGRFVYGAELSLLEAVKKGSLQGKVKVLPTGFSESGRYIAFSKKVPDATIEKCARLWKSSRPLESFRKSLTSTRSDR